MLTGLVFSACNNSKPEQVKENISGQTDTSQTTKDELVWLTIHQQKAIGLELGHIEERNLNSSVKVTGRLELPPQYRAEVSTFMGGNVKEVKVIEGDYVKKGQVLAVLEHPDYIELQQNFQQLTSSLDYLKEEYQRKKTLYGKEVSSAKDYQKASADYKAAMANYRGMKEKLQLLGLNPEAVEKGSISATLAVRSPINGYVNTINVSTGKYVAPQATMFEITNNAHVHADFMVYEKDIYKVEEGQIVNFTVSNLPDKILQGKIFSVGKNFESDPRAIHVHADVITPNVKLLPGMYVNGRLLVNDVKVRSLPQSAIMSEGDKNYIFIKVKEGINPKDQQDSVTAFKMMEITTGVTDQGYTEINILQPLPDSTIVVTKGAYYLQAEMTKGENVE